MPYVFDDDAFAALQEAVQNLSDLDKPMTMVEQQALAFVLLFVVSHASKVARAQDIDMKKVDDDIEGLVVNASAAFASLLAHLSNEVGGVVMGKVNGIPWFYADELAPEACGFIPTFLELDDERPMKEQINDRYIAGWRPFEGFQIKAKSWTIAYPGDPDMQPLAGTALHGEVLAIYPYGWTMIVSKDNDFEIARLD